MGKFGQDRRNLWMRDAGSLHASNVSRFSPRLRADLPAHRTCARMHRRVETVRRSHRLECGAVRCCLLMFPVSTCSMEISVRPIYSGQPGKGTAVGQLCEMLHCGGIGERVPELVAINTDAISPCTSRGTAIDHCRNSVFPQPLQGLSEMHRAAGPFRKVFSHVAVFYKPAQRGREYRNFKRPTPQT